YPEPGDEVVVGFFDGDPAAPVILGSLFSPVNKAPTQPDDQNNEKTIAFNTSQGLCQLEFNKASSAISLRTKESSLQLEKGISLNSDTSIDTVAKKTTIEGQDINISGKKTVAIKSVKINLSH
ncbi:MAG: phage baseplate assembly protein V, partial [Kluyvera sp.]